MDAPTVIAADACFADPGVLFSYGTAGFRTNASLLPRAVFRVGLLAALRSKSQGGRDTGVMITASHNPVQDNGVKIVDASGEMLTSNWEPFATAVVNASSSADLCNILNDIVSRFTVDLSVQAVVHVGYDSRPSSPSLVAALCAGLQTCQPVSVRNHGLVSTPVLHYCVAYRCSPERYIRDTRDALAAALKVDADSGTDWVARLDAVVRSSNLVVDAANGVGAISFRLVCPEIPVINDGTLPGQTLNEHCGSEHVQKERDVPMDTRDSAAVAMPSVYASFDGDADRLVFSQRTAAKEFILWDGDKISALFAWYLRSEHCPSAHQLPVAVVQTAYANGSATRFLKGLGCDILLAKTGVKYLHHAAVHYCESVHSGQGVAIYFEANGHGTVVFGRQVAGLYADNTGDPLGWLASLMHPTVGDAIRDMLCVVACLARTALTFHEWNNMYQDMPSIMGKARVTDRTAFKCTADETRLVEPRELQSEIDDICRRHADQHARAFVRPSGTEDCVRTYVEASSAAVVDDIAQRLGCALLRYQN